MNDLNSESIRLKEIQRQQTNNDKEFSEKNMLKNGNIYLLKNPCDKLTNI